MNNLPEIIRDAMHKQDLTYREVAEHAERRGFKIGHSTVYDYAKGTKKRYQRDHLKAIAAGLGLSAQRLIEVAGLPREHEPFVLPEESSILTPDEREAVRGVVKTMIETRKQVMGNAEHPAPNKRAAGSAADGKDINPDPDAEVHISEPMTEEEMLGLAAEHGHEGQRKGDTGEGYL